MAQFAIRGYAVDALDYVLKPVPYFAFSQQLQKAVDRLRKRQTVFLTVPVEGGLRRIDVSALYYLASEGHSVRFYTEYGDFFRPRQPEELRGKTGGPALCPVQQRAISSTWPRCWRCSRTPSRWGPHHLQISRPRKKAFLEALTDYIGGSGK